MDPVFRTAVSTVQGAQLDVRSVLFIASKRNKVNTGGMGSKTTSSSGRPVCGQTPQDRFSYLPATHTQKTHTHTHERTRARMHTGNGSSAAGSTK